MNTQANFIDIAPRLSRPGSNRTARVANVRLGNSNVRTLRLFILGALMIPRGGRNDCSRNQLVACAQYGGVHR